MSFRIFEISADSITGDEQLGSKPKFWFTRDSKLWLFKERRPNTGEDWAEKLASEIARHIEVQAAEVELAAYEGRMGCASKMFVEPGEDLLHGNEILAGQITGYDRDKRMHHCEHTLSNIVSAVQRMLDDPAVSTQVLRILASYMVLDAVICNTDRHHENWGFLMRYEERQPGTFVKHLRVAQSFDHASSLGRELLDERRMQILQAQDGIQRYALAGQGGIYLTETDRRGANPLKLIELGVHQHPEYFRPVLQRLRHIALEPIMDVVDAVPPERISETARAFVRALLKYTHTALSGLAS